MHRSTVSHRVIYGLVCLLLVFGLIIGCNQTVQQKTQSSPTPQKQTITLKGKDLQGVQFTAVDEQRNQLNFQIRDVEVDPKDHDKEIYLYTVFYQDPKDSQWKNLCQPDRQKVAKAMPLKGEWDSQGNYIASNVITFGCTGGNVAKCARFGYKPWKTVNGKSLRDAHQACTRMLKADYCGNGNPHTRQGTPIFFYDVVGVEKPDPDPDKTMVFEAAWNANGATFVNRQRWTESPAKLLQECPEKLKGHINLHYQPMTMQEVLQKAPDSLIFNDSIIRQPQPQ